MTDTQTLKAISQLRTQIAKVEDRQVKAAVDLQKASTDLAVRQRKTSGRDTSRPTKALKDRITALDKTQTGLKADRLKLQDRLKDLLDGIAVTSPQELVGKLDIDAPVVLFPAKIETRFFNNGRADELRVRIFPDQVAISALQEALTDAEIDAGKSFWTEIATAHQDDNLDAREAAEAAAANTLATRSEGNRTLWIAMQMRPTNWPVSAGGSSPAPDALDFPRNTPAPTNAAAAVRILPDRFVVETHRKGKLVHSVTGAAIRDVLMMAPDGDGQTAIIERDTADGTIKASETLNWLFDYDAAVAAGMAVTIPITPTDRRAGFDKVLAMGVRYSETPQASAQLLEKHFTALRFSTGIDILPQGTPTNNTDDAKSGFTTGEVTGSDDVLRFLRDDAPATANTHREKSDGHRLADALGISPNTVSGWLNASNRDVAEALAMNRALWSATLGGYMRDFLNPLTGGTSATSKDRQLAGQITAFGTDYVTGRGLLPAIRVGRQPYGLLITSDYKTYDTDERLLTRRPKFPARIKPVVEQFTTLFRGLEDRLKAIGQDGVPEDILTNILGLHASSVTYASRKAVADAVSWNNMSMLGFDQELADLYFEFILGLRKMTLGFIGLGTGPREIAEITFMSETDALNGPVVDGDPDVPLSETAAIRPYNGSENYIGWLLSQSADTIRAQKFTDAGGDTVARPTALLYKYLRHALLAEIGEQSAALASTLAKLLVSRVDAHSSLVGVDGIRDTLKLPNDTATVLRPAEVGVDTRESNLGNFLWAETRKPKLPNTDTRPFTLDLKDTREALETLSDLPTGRLERLFAEHMDTCSYRLDAWHSGMFASRLTAMREKNKKSKGLYIGLYGYVENLRARPAPVKLRARDIPEGLTPDGVTEVVSLPDNGGFVHAPSQAHAVTAAVLRNGYLSHADKTQDNRFAINLDSSRVRKAMAIVEGLRANQTLSALLGYRLERGLHENHPGLELDAFIYVLRERFPITSKRLVPVAAGISSEVVEARNVVDGYDLIEQARDKSYPWGVSGLPPKTSDEAKAIVAEVDELEDIFDAYGDLIMAETVHQAVNGSVERARGALQSIAEGDVPPVPEVAQTPRSGTVLSQTVIAEFPAAAHWPTTTPRGAVNGRMNGWLVARLPDPAEITVGFKLDGNPPEHMTLADAGLDAIDAVLMAGDGQGSGSTPLERWLLDRWRDREAIPETTLTTHRDGPPAPAGAASVLSMDTGQAPANGQALDLVLPLLLALQKIITKARPAQALDYRLSTELSDALPDNPKGLRLSGGEPLARAGLTTALSTFDTLIGDLGAAVADQGLQAAYAALLDDITTFDAADWSGFATGVRATMRALVLFGHTQATPVRSASLDAAGAKALYEQASQLLLALNPHLTAAQKAFEPVPDDTQGSGGQALAQLTGRRVKALDATATALFTKSFRLTHEFTLEAEQRAELQPALDAPIEKDPLALEQWLQGLVRMRKPLSELSVVRDWGDWTGVGTGSLTPVQLPRIAGDPWIGGAWTPQDDIRDRLGLMLVDSDGQTGGARAGILLDGFSETVPTKTEVTGVSFHYDRPNAEAPQAILVTVPPILKDGWSWDALRGSVFDTFDRARLRAVEPDHLTGTPYFHVLPANLVPFSKGFLLSTLLATNATTLASTLTDTP